MTPRHAAPEDPTATAAPAGLAPAENPDPAPPGPGPEAGARDGTSRAVRLRLRGARTVILLGLLMVGVVVLGLLTRADAPAPLSPANAAPTGARALAQVLQDRGVRVVAPGSLAEAEDALGAGPATLFLHDPNGWLNEDQLGLLSAASQRRVLAAPSEVQLRSFAPEVEPAGAVDGGAAPAPADCPVEEAAAAGTISAGGLAYTGGTGCFTAPTLSEGTGASYVASKDGRTAVLGYPEILSNGLITEEGNAALALGALGRDATLVWYQPTTADLAVTGTPSDSDPLNLLPGWTNTVMLWLLGCAFLAMVWRGRRMGPLAAEPLPVLVRSAETAEGRARLYQDSRAVAHAAATLRAASLSRIAVRLRLPHAAAPAEVIGAASRATGRPHGDLERMLVSYAPPNNRELVRLSQELLELEKEIISQ